jgi:hypothetical protein
MSELTSSVLRPQLARLDRLMATRRRRTLYVLDALDRRPDVVPVPHHDPDNAVGVAIRCSSSEHAKRLQELRGVFRLIDTGRHVHTNWEPVLVRRSHHPSIDTWAWAYGSADAAPSVDCPNVIDILERTCAIIIDPEIPGPIFRRMVSKLRDAVEGLDRTPGGSSSGSERVARDPEDVRSPDPSNAPSAAS